MIANILKYGSVNPIILCYVYSGLSGTIEVVVWNSIGLMRNTEFDSQVDR